MGVLLTAADTLLLLWFQSFGIRTIEAFILALITVMAGCFCIEIVWAKPSVSEIFTGLVPRLNRDSLYVAIGILGATVMPHNLYLHSALVQTRHIGHSEAAKRSACRYNLIDSAVALNGAMFVNCAILVLAAAVFFKRGIVVTQIQQAQVLLAPLLGTNLAGVMFAVALLCSGQSSTLTGTMAGQVVMEGFLNFRMRPWLRRLVTRALAILPAAFTIYFAGDQSTFGLLILSQVILSMQLPFAVIPLIHFTSDRARMGSFANSLWVRVLAWSTAAVIVGLNLRLAWMAIADWLAAAGAWRTVVWLATIPTAAVLLLLLLWVTMEPLISRWTRKFGRAPVVLPEIAGAEAAAAPVYHRILVPLDHTQLDRLAVSHAAAMAKLHGAELFLLHVEEGRNQPDLWPGRLHGGSRGGRTVPGAHRSSPPRSRDHGRNGDHPLLLAQERDCALRTRNQARPDHHGRARPRRSERPDLRHHHQPGAPQPGGAHADRETGQTRLRHHAQHRVAGTHGEARVRNQVLLNQQLYLA